MASVVLHYKSALLSTGLAILSFFAQTDVENVPLILYRGSTSGTVGSFSLDGCPLVKSPNFY